MAFRRPLYVSSSNLREMTDTQISDIRTAITNAYNANPSVQLNVGGGSGWTQISGTLQDTRLQAGGYSSYTTRFPNSGETEDVSVVTATYNTVFYRNVSVSAPTDSGTSYPLYYTTSGQLRAMSLQDIYDTFVYSAIDSVITSTTPYQITTSSSSPGGYSYLGNVFNDTRANVGAYTYDQIPETRDQPFTVQSFYLHQNNGSVGTSFDAPVFMNGSNQTQTYAASTFRDLLVDITRYVAANVAGYVIKYAWNPATGTALGSSITDTRLNGSGNYQTLYVNTDDYRAQEFPDGTPVVINTYTLKAWRE